MESPYSGTKNLNIRCIEILEVNESEMTTIREEP